MVAPDPHRRVKRVERDDVMYVRYNRGLCRQGPWYGARQGIPQSGAGLHDKTDIDTSAAGSDHPLRFPAPYPWKIAVIEDT